jgi:thioredoxin-like negative regulator of GroEL
LQKTINSLGAFELFLNVNLTAAVYFSTPECNVCKVLKPKFKELLNDEFPKISFAYVNVSDAIELAAQNSVFTVPTIVFFFDGKESLRKSRNINLDELKKELRRPYSFLFE